MKLKKRIALFLAFVLLLGLMAVPASAAAVETVTVKLQIGSGEATVLGTYTKDESFKTYRDANAKEIPGVTNATFANYGDANNKNNYILYTGTDGGKYARAGVVTKYIDIVALAKAMTRNAYDAETWDIKMATAGDSWTTTYGKGAGAKRVDASGKLYASFSWLQACQANGGANFQASVAETTKSLNLTTYTDAHEVPAVLAIVSYNDRLSKMSLTADSDLKAAVGELVNKADMANALRFFSGMDTAVTDGGFLNTGANCQYNVSEITLIAPEGYDPDAYNITVANDESDHATVTVAEGKTSAKKGTDVSFTVAADEGYTVKTVKVNDEAVTAKDGIYTFTMPEADVAISVETAAKPVTPPTPPKPVSAPRDTVWDGKSVDVNWYDPAKTSYTISTAAELAGVAALINGLVNEDCEVYSGGQKIAASVWNADREHVNEESNSATGGNRATPLFHWGVENFDGRTIKLGADLDMSAGNYMPLGGQYLMKKGDNKTRVDASFCGVFDGQGHKVTIQCDRHSGTSNYGDGQSVGLIGRLGLHDNDPKHEIPDSPTVRNVAVYGKVYGNRSIGGVVGKVGKTVNGGFIEGCANFATVEATDTKGVGGIVGAGWNGGTIENCYNAGKIIAAPNANGGISGSNENDIKNCFNIGSVWSENITTETAAIASINSGKGSFENCYWLTGSANMGVYNKELETVVEKSEEEMKSTDFLKLLGSAFAKDVNNINNGYPVLAWQNPKPVEWYPSAPETPSTTVSGNTATTTVTESALGSSLSSALAQGLTAVEISVDAKNAATSEVLLPIASVDKIAKADMGVSVKNTDGTALKLDAQMLRSVAEQAAGGELKLSVAAKSAEDAKQLVDAGVDLTNSVTVAIDLASGDKKIDKFGGSLGITFPVDSAKFTAGKRYTIYQISDNGQRETLAGKCVMKNGAATIDISVSHLSTFVITNTAVFYEDVQSGDWFYDAVAFVADRGLMQGVSDTVFAPGGTMTRAMLANVLYRYAGEPKGNFENSFSDVQTGKWYTKAVLWANAQKVAEGYGKDVFGIDDPVSREQMASILYRYAKSLPGADESAKGDLSRFKDSKTISDWAVESMEWAVGVGLFSGYQDGSVRPTAFATRAEVAKLLRSFVSYLER